MTSAFDFSGPSRVIASTPSLRRKLVNPHRDNRLRASFSPPVIGGAQAQADRDANNRIRGRSNSMRSQ